MVVGAHLSYMYVRIWGQKLEKKRWISIGSIARIFLNETNFHWKSKSSLFPNSETARDREINTLAAITICSDPHTLAYDVLIRFYINVLWYIIHIFISFTLQGKFHSHLVSDHACSCNAANLHLKRKLVVIAIIRVWKLGFLLSHGIVSTLNYIFKLARVLN